MAVSYLPVSWSTYHGFAQKLAATILSHDLKLNEIVAVSRGGLTLGHLMADFLQLPVFTFTIQSYKQIQEQGKANISEPLSRPIKDKNILLVDDVADSGTTLKRALNYLEKLNPRNITTITMFVKPTSSVKPDFYAEITDKWIIYPYEVTETIMGITRQMLKSGKSKAQIQKQLQELGFTLKQIAFVRKYYQL